MLTVSWRKIAQLPNPTRTQAVIAMKRDAGLVDMCIGAVSRVSLQIQNYWSFLIKPSSAAVSAPQTATITVHSPPKRHKSEVFHDNEKRDVTNGDDTRTVDLFNLSPKPSTPSMSSCSSPTRSTMTKKNQSYPHIQSKSPSKESVLLDTPKTPKMKHGNRGIEQHSLRNKREAYRRISDFIHEKIYEDARVDSRLVKTPKRKRKRNRMPEESNKRMKTV